MEKYALKYVYISLAQTVISYTLGAILSFKQNITIGMIFLILCLVNIIISMRFRCTYCWYYGKRCGSGFGWVASKLFKRQNPGEFEKKQNVIITASIGMVTTVYPILIGIILLIGNFSGIRLTILILYVIISIIPNFLFRPKMCADCKQGELGCPAYNKMKD
jgi:hypothetical protein